MKFFYKDFFSNLPQKGKEEIYLNQITLKQTGPDKRSKMRLSREETLLSLEEFEKLKPYKLSLSKKQISSLFSKYFFIGQHLERECLTGKKYISL